MPMTMASLMMTDKNLASAPTLKTGSRTSKSKRFPREVHVKMMMMMSLMWMKKMVVLD